MRCLSFVINKKKFGKKLCVGMLKMSGSKPKLKVRPLDEMFKKISESSEEKFEDTKGAIRNRISKKNRQHNGQKKVQKDKQRFQLVEVCHQYNKHKTDIIKICNALFVIFHQ
jgi:hypothetical protein